jgi:hypothetical protein
MERTQTQTTTDSDETMSLIGSDKVEGTAVYDLSGDKVGAIERIMIDKRQGTVAYAVMSFGGFLGMGQDHYPLPWAKLTYDENLDGYRVDIDKNRLEGAPKYQADEEYDWSDRTRGRSINDYYGVSPYRV